MIYRRKLTEKLTCLPKRVILWVTALFAILAFFSQPAFASDYYFDKESVLSTGDSRFPKAVTNEKESAVFWQEVNKNTHEIWISGRYYKTVDAPVKMDRIAGPYTYSGDVPDIFTAAMNESGQIVIAALGSNANHHNEVEVWISKDPSNGKSSFTKTTLETTSTNMVAPRIFAASKGWRIFSSQSDETSFDLMSATSTDGQNWTAFTRFSGAESYDFKNPFAPHLSHFGNTDVVVFQAQYAENNRYTFQLYATFSTDSGNNWTRPVLISGQDSITDNSSFAAYHNRNPFVYATSTDIHVAWERTPQSSENARIWTARITERGVVARSAEEVTDRGNSGRAQIFTYDDTLSMVWFDSRLGREEIYFAQKSKVWGSAERMSSNDKRDSSFFPFPVITDNGLNLSFIWEKSRSKSNYQIVLKKADTTVAQTFVTPLNYKLGQRSNSTAVRYKLTFTEDEAGLYGYSYSWSQDDTVEPARNAKYILMSYDTSANISVKADNDGTWYFKLRTFDNAGNISDISTVTYYLDNTPPLPPVIDGTATDKYGFASSNAPVIRFQPDALDDDVAGYTYALTYIGAIPSSLESNYRHPIGLREETVLSRVEDLQNDNLWRLEKGTEVPKRLLTSKTSATFDRKNGIYLFSVAAIDTVGNISATTSSLVLLNKYVPDTRITKIPVSTETETGELQVSLTGQDFTYYGTVTDIYIDEDGAEPYQLALSSKNGDFLVTGNTKIENVRLGYELDEGGYRIGLKHSGEKKIIWTKTNFLKIDQAGTVKIETPYKYIPDWKIIEEKPASVVSSRQLLLAAILLLGLLSIVLAIRGYIATAKEAVIIRKEIHALIYGGPMPKDSKFKDKNISIGILKKRSGSLKYKLIGFTVALVFGIALAVSLPLGSFMLRIQTETMGEGLLQRVEVLSESITNSSKEYLPKASSSVFELNNAIGQASALSEARYATITGASEDEGKTGINYIWATSNTDLKDVHRDGTFKLEEDYMPLILENLQKLDEEAALKAGPLAQRISELNSEDINVTGRTDEEIDADISATRTEMNEILNSMANGAFSSIPPYDYENMELTPRNYLFYKPIMYRQGNTGSFVHGIVFVEVSTEALVENINMVTRYVFIIAAIISVLVITIGAILSMILASAIAKPIKKLAKHVQVIAGTKDKMKLKGKNIQIKSNDEIGTLSDVVNEMTQSLAKAAEDEKLLMDGKVVQQAFLPLSRSQQGLKETVSRLQTEALDAFGYYEGASGVSGDYFDYKKLDERWYVIIKCDASGHGVPAAIIMTVVATLFRKYFENWSYAKNGTNLNVLVNQINDFIESLGLKGKFATIILCLFDTKTGDVYMCNAGDNIVHIFDSETKKQKVITLTETPAAGPLPSFLVEMKGGFAVQKTNLKKGDILYLYTDGIEESTRRFRDKDFNLIVCNEPGLKEGEEHGNHKVGADTELLEADRVSEIIEAVLNKKQFILTKYHNPIPGESLVFDFSSCEGTIDETIIALVAVEKIFRFYKSPEMGEADVVTVDRRIDDFLHKHFNRYDFYCKEMTDLGQDSNYCEYRKVAEDEQLDDLTLLAVKRN